MNIYIGTNQRGELGISLSPYDFSRIIDQKPAEWHSIPVWEYNDIFYRPNIVGDFNGNSILELPTVVKTKTMPQNREVPTFPNLITYHRHKI